MTIEIFGTICPQCQQLAANARRAANRLGVPFELYRVTDLNAIMARGVLFTPAMAVDGHICSAGKMLDEAEITKLLTAELRN